MAKSGKSGGSNGGKHGKDVTVGPHKDSDKWAVTREGNSRASNLTEKKQDAVDLGRKYARQDHSELVIKGLDGRIQSKDSHGHDPRSRKG